MRIREIHTKTIYIVGENEKEVKERVEYYEKQGFKLVSFNEIKHKTFKYEAIVDIEIDFLVNSKPLALKTLKHFLRDIKEKHPCVKYEITDIDTFNKEICVLAKYTNCKNKKEIELEEANVVLAMETQGPYTIIFDESWE